MVLARIGDALNGEGGRELEHLRQCTGNSGQPHHQGEGHHYARQTEPHSLQPEWR